MTARSSARAIAILVMAGILPLAGPLGCASSSPKKDKDLDVKRARSHFNLAVDHVERGRIELGLRELLTAERIDPENPRIHHALGAAYLRKEKVAEAEKHLLRALEIRPDYQDARFNLSSLYLLVGRYEECMEHSRILFDDPTFVAPWRALTNQGWAAYKLGRIAEARRDLERSREYNPEYWPTLLNLGIFEAEQGRTLEAIRLYAKVLELGPGPSAEAEVNYRLGEIFVALGKRERAVGYLRTAVMKAPSGRWGRKSEEYLKLLR
jgi:tetratricopeptide (TPR) repeat protein